MLNAFKDILKKRRFTKVRSDKGSVFVSRQFKSYMKQQGIYFFTTQNVSKAGYAERVQRTLRSMMMRHQRSYKCLDNLQALVDSYNNSPHRSLKELCPNQITERGRCMGFSTLKTAKIQ